MDFLSLFKTSVEIVQGVVIICVTLFTAWWTYRTFGHKEKIQELKDLKRTIEEFYHAITVFCIQVRLTKEPNKEEIQEKLQLAQLHNRLVGLASLNLYTKEEIRNKIQGIVGSWITDRRIERMQRRPGWEQTEEERSALWKKFESEYREVKGLIDKEANRVL